MLDDVEAEPGTSNAVPKRRTDPASEQEIIEADAILRKSSKSALQSLRQPVLVALYVKYNPGKEVEGSKRMRKEFLLNELNTIVRHFFRLPDQNTLTYLLTSD